MVNQIFGTSFDKTCVIAGWSEDQLATFSKKDLDRLLKTCNDEGGTMANRLKIRIRNVKDSRKADRKCYT